MTWIFISLYVDPKCSEFIGNVQKTSLTQSIEQTNR
jgi:hypothetical protein